MERVNGVENVQKTNGCRICGCTHLVAVLHLGDPALTGVFLKFKTQDAPIGPLLLVESFVA